MTTLPYLLTASLYLLLFYGCYWLLVRRNTFFGLNRAYLLASVVLSLLLPLLKLPGEAVESLSIGSITLPAFVAGNTTTIGNDAWSLTNWVWLIYGLGATVMLMRLGWNLWTVFRLIRRGTAERRSTYILVRLPQESTPDGRTPDGQTPSFSFGRYLVLNHTDALTESAALLRHEEAHIRQYHTADVLFLEIVQVAFWFNPVVRFYKQSVQEVHEFLADRAVLKTPQPDYAHQLVAYALNVSPSALITPFVSKSTLKQRIVMLQKPQTHRRALLGYALALPLAALLVMCTQPDRDLSQAETTIHANQPARQANVDGEIFTVVENQPEFQGGMKELGAYLQKNLRYPESAQKANAQGKVFISFIVTKTGEIADVKLLKGIGFGADEEAIRVVQSMPRWIPGSQSGQVVNVRYNLPIRFELDDKEWGTLKKVSPPPPPPPVEKKSAFFPVPTDDADIQKAYKHFIINDKEVSFNEFRKYDKDGIVEVSSSEQSIRIETK